MGHWGMGKYHGLTIIVVKAHGKVVSFPCHGESVLKLHMILI
mgnify:FL=1